ncbi:hypothetical protein ACVBEH_07595 [Roseateles sp. GG27B]
MLRLFELGDDANHAAEASARPDKCNDKRVTQSWLRDVGALSGSSSNRLSAPTGNQSGAATGLRGASGKVIALAKAPRVNPATASEVE